MFSSDPKYGWKSLASVTNLFERHQTDNGNSLLRRIMLPASGTEITSWVPKGQICHHFTLKEITSATDNFSKELIIGKGGFGYVYKGVSKDGTDVAIKRWIPGFGQGAREFQTEVEILPMLQHSNIVNLIGCYSGFKEKILVYEYMHNGDLGAHLHKHRTSLSWSQRLKIVIDVARALDYLHNKTDKQHIIHTDPSSSNILLDKQWRAKVTDFGFSKIIPVDGPSKHVSTNVVGTMGYFDPEYLLTGTVSKKSDVYTFGVVMFEVLCRRHPMDWSSDREPWALTVWAQDCLKKGELRSIIDPHLRWQMSLACLNDYVKIAQGCLHRRSKQRITIAKAVVGLESILALHERTGYSTPHMAISTSDRIFQKHPFSFEGMKHKKAVKFLSFKSQQLNEDHGQLSDEISQEDVISEASYQLEKSLKHKSPVSYEEFDPGSEPNHAVIDEEFLSRSQTESSHDLTLQYYLRQRPVVKRRKDLLHKSPVSEISQEDVISEASYQLEKSLKLKSPVSYEEFDPGSEPNRAVIDEESLSRSQTESSHDLTLQHYLRQRLVLTRRKDLLHLIWSYPMKKEVEVHFGSLVGKFSSLNKYINKSLGPSRDGDYLMEIQTLLHDIEEHLDDAAFDMVAYLLEGMVSYRSWAVEFENLGTEANSGQVPYSSFWSNKPEIHAKRIASVRERALKCIKDLKIEKLWISGSGAEEVAATLKALPELKSVFVMLEVKHHSVKELISEIEEKMHLWKKRGSEPGSMNVSDNFLKCLLFVDFVEDFIDFQEIEFHLSKFFQTVQIVMTSGLETRYCPVDLEITVQDHLLPWMLFSMNVDLAAEGKHSIFQQMVIRLVEECNGHLLAIILLARALRAVVDVSIWELALQEVSQQEPSSQSGVISDVMLRVLRFVWSRMESMSQKCIMQFALHYTVEFGKSSLINSWITDGLVNGEQEGKHVFEDLRRSFLIEQFGENCVKMREEARVTLVAYFVPRAYGLYLIQDRLESKRIPNIEEWDAREIHLVNNTISELPDNPKCPILVDLFLNSNQDLMDIPITFFDNMPSLQVLDLSSTSIKCLPSSISMLTTLRKLFVRNCDLMMKLPIEIGALKNLKVFDSEGTQLICLPEQFGSLTKLECLKFSLYNFADGYKQSNQSMQIIPAANLSKLVRLKELSICVDSHDEWWENEVKLIIDILYKLRNLESLRVYFPTTELLLLFMDTQNWEGIPIYQKLTDFSFIVGQPQCRVISRLTPDLEKMFVKLPKCLKYTNGEGDAAVITRAIKHVNALFLNRHWTIQSLSNFGLEKMERLKFCLLVEYLSIHYMKSLACIWSGPISSVCLSNLKTLLIHTCPILSTIFTQGLLDNLPHLEYLVIDDCEQITSLVSLGSNHSGSTSFLPNLKKMTLLHLPELVSICGSISFSPRLESLVVYDCPELKKLPYMEVSDDDSREIKGEKEWLDVLEWSEPEWPCGRPDYLASVFIPLGRDGDIMDELANAVNFLPHSSD